MLLIESGFCKLTTVNIIASNKQNLDVVLLCIPSLFGLVKFGQELSGLVLVWYNLVCYVRFWFGMGEFGLVWLRSVSYG